MHINICKYFRTGRHYALMGKNELTGIFRIHSLLIISTNAFSIMREECISNPVLFANLTIKLTKFVFCTSVMIHYGDVIGVQNTEILTHIPLLARHLIRDIFASNDRWSFVLVQIQIAVDYFRRKNYSVELLGADLKVHNSRLTIWIFRL